MSLLLVGGDANIVNDAETPSAFFCSTWNEVGQRISIK